MTTPADRAKNNPWAICRASVGTDQTKFEACVLEAKKKMGLHSEMTEAQYMAEGQATDGPQGQAFVPFKITAPSGMELGLSERARLMKFAELECEIFEEGIHDGELYTPADMLTLKQNFDEFGRDRIQPPLVLGHDEKQPLIQNMGMPSLGWLKSVRLDRKPNGKVSAIGKFSDVPEVARQAIQKRLYKRISSEIYSNFSNPNIDGGKQKGKTFRRISLLGADIPEVKTLADVVAFGESNDKFIYAENEGESAMDAAAIKELQDNIAKLSEAQKAGDATVAKLSEAHKASEANVAALKAENDQLKKDRDSLSLEFTKSVQRERANAISSFIEAQKAAGKILPAWEEKGLRKFMESLDDKKVMKFSEKDAAEVSSLSFFQEFIKSMPNVVKLGELTTEDMNKIAEEKGQATDGVKANVTLDSEVRKYMEAEKKVGKVVTYAEGLRAVSVANPELVQKIK